MKKPEATRSMVLASGAVAGGAVLVDPPPLLAVRKPTSTLSMPRVVDPFSAKIVREVMALAELYPKKTLPGSGTSVALLYCDPPFTMTPKGALVDP
jgi:hypothetical protein